MLETVDKVAAFPPNGDNSTQRSRDKEQEWMSDVILLTMLSFPEYPLDSRHQLAALEEAPVKLTRRSSLIQRLIVLSY